MRKVFIGVLVGILPFIGNAQLIGNRFDNSIVYPNGTVTFNTSDAVLGASYLKYADSSFKATRLIYGASLQAKNNEGISKLFDGGSFTPEGKINLTFGGTHIKYYDVNEQSAKAEVKKVQEKKLALLDKYNSSIMDTIVKVLGVIPDKKIRDSITKDVKNLFTTTLEDFEERILKYAAKHKNEKEPLMQLATELVVLQKDFQKNWNLLDKEGEVALQNVKTKWSKRWTYYLNFGMGANAFKQYEMRDSINFSNNFSNMQFEGASLAIGGNFKWGATLLFGASIGYRHWNNLETLTSKDYTLRTTTTSGNSEVISEKKVTGYSGVYGEFNQTSLNLDVVWFIANRMMVSNSNPHKTTTEKETKNILGVNPYFSFKASDKKTVYPNVANVGLNLFIFKPDGKFSGGIFVELPDIKNNLERMKVEPNLRDAQTRLSFGLVGKIAIGSLFAPNF